MANLFFAAPVQVDIKLEGEEERRQVELKLDKGRKESCPVYFDGESLVGSVSFRVSVVIMSSPLGGGTRVH